MNAELDQHFVLGVARAEEHMRQLLACARFALPESLHAALPKTMDDLETLFSGSTKLVCIAVFSEADGYAPMSAVFEFGEWGGEKKHWQLSRYALTIPGSMFHAPIEYSATCLEDALVISRRIAKYRAEHIVRTENSKIEATPASNSLQ